MREFFNKSSASFIAGFLLIVIVSLGVLTGLSAYANPVTAAFSAAVGWFRGM